MKKIQFLKKITIVMILLLSIAIPTIASIQTHTGDRLIIQVKEDDCIGCGYCENVAPNVFFLYKDKPLVLVGFDNPANYQEIIDAMMGCPTAAIILEFK